MSEEDLFRTFDGKEEVILISLVAGLLAALLTMGTAKWASRPACTPIESGVLSTIPSAIIPASIAFVLLDEHIEVVDALYSVPTGILLNAFFLTVWRKLPPLLGHCRAKMFSSLLPLLVLSVVISVLVWGIAFISLFGILNILPLLLKRIIAAGCTFFMFFFGILLARLQSFPSQNQSEIKYLVLYILLGSLSFLAITTSVIVSILNEVAAGLISTFPCVFMISMLSHWTYQATTSRGKELITTSASRLYIAHLVLGSLSISSYCILFATFYENGIMESTPIGFPFGLILAACSSWALSFLFVSIPIILVLRWVQVRKESKISGVVISFTEKSSLLYENSETPKG